MAFALHVTVPPGSTVGSKVEVILKKPDGQEPRVGEQVVAGDATLVFTTDPPIDSEQLFTVRHLGTDGNQLSAVSVKCLPENVGPPTVAPPGCVKAWFEPAA